MNGLRWVKEEFYIAPNMIYDQPLNEHAKFIYTYLCRRADRTGNSFPSYSKIMKDCSIGSRNAVSDSLKALKSLGLLEYEKRKRADGSISSNMYRLSAVPTSQEEPQKEPLKLEKEDAIQQIRLVLNRYEGVIEEVLLTVLNRYKGVINEVQRKEDPLNHTQFKEDSMREREGAATPPPLEPAPAEEKNMTSPEYIQHVEIETEADPEPPAPKGTTAPAPRPAEIKGSPPAKVPAPGGRLRAFGKYSMVWLTDEEYNGLLTDFRPETITDYIQRIDLHCMSKGKFYNSYSATIRKWITDDIRDGKTSFLEQGHFQPDEERKKLLEAQERIRKNLGDKAAKEFGKKMRL